MSKDPDYSFQDDAVSTISKAYSEEKNGRYLVVIPTGGGKTRVAVRAVNKLFDERVLHPKNDLVLWVCHREELQYQAKEAFDEYLEYSPGKKSYADRIRYSQLAGIKEAVASGDYSFVVIDEAHHSAANSYQPIFKDKYGAQTDLGVLGLTATPSRHDGEPLDFEEEIYSIGFGDCVQRGVILMPKIVTVEGEKFTDIYSLEEEGDLERFNTHARNQKIIDALVEGADKYKKAVIYVGTKKHLHDLYDRCKTSELKDHYESIDWILGGQRNNSRRIVRKDFIKQMKATTRSILINVDVLTEGFDDPTIDTVVMGRQTNSMLVYFQAMGRSVRRKGKNKQAFLIEIEDELPNIQYYMDNRWLSLEVSACLEPLVEDCHYRDEADLKKVLKDLYDRHCVKKEFRLFPEFKPESRYGVLLFKVYIDQERAHHIPLLLTSKTKLKIRPVFQYLSERLAHSKDLYKNNRAAAIFSRWFSDIEDIPNFKDNLDEIWQAMLNAGKTVSNSRYEGKVPSTIFAHKSRDKSWITYASLSPNQDEESDWEEFISEMVNADHIRDSLTQGFESGDVIIKIPLGLGGCIGRIISSEQFETFSEIVENLGDLVKQMPNEDHSLDLTKIISDSNIPIENKYHHGVPIIIREDLTESYYFKL